MTRPGTMPFPVAPTYRVRADVAPLCGPHTIRDEEAPAYAEAKRAVLARAPQRHRALAAGADVAGVREALTRFAAVAAEEQDGTLAAQELRAAAEAGNIATDPPSHRHVLDLADRIALAVQEDLVVMRAGLGAELLHVCFPSHWDPGAHAGSPLAELHGPVPSGGRLRGASDNLLKAMVEKGPFERWVWSVNASGTLSQHPAEPRQAPPPDGSLIDRLWFRVERQTTLPLADLGRSVFTIRIFQSPLVEVLAEDGRAERLAEAIESMDAALRTYKGLAGAGGRLIAELEAYGRGRGAA